MISNISVGKIASYFRANVFIAKHSIFFHNEFFFRNNLFYQPFCNVTVFK